MVRAYQKRSFPSGDRPGNCGYKQGFAGERASAPKGLEVSTEGANSHDCSRSLYCKTVLPTEERCVSARIHRKGQRMVHAESLRYQYSGSGVMTQLGWVMTQLGWVMSHLTAVLETLMKTIGKSDHARRTPARQAGGIRLSFPTRREVMRTLAGIRPMRVPASCHSQQWHGASTIRIRAGD
jgi:hypothetical protein